MMVACSTSTPMVITVQNNTEISSPKYPENYPNNLDCTWHIVADHDKRIELSVKGYDIENEYVFIRISCFFVTLMAF